MMTIAVLVEEFSPTWGKMP